MAPAHTSALCPRTRRALLGSALALGTTLAFPPTTSLVTASQSETMTGLWRTWLLTSGRRAATATASCRRPRTSLPSWWSCSGNAPPRPSRRSRSGMIRRSSCPGRHLALDLIRVHTPNPVRAARALALLHVALFDTLVATEDARTAFPRPGPAMMGPSCRWDGRPVAASSFPSEHAAVAAAAATVLAYLFPEESADDLQRSPTKRRTPGSTAGRAFRSDVEAGQAIGRAVGERAVARGKADGSDDVLGWLGAADGSRLLATDPTRLFPAAGRTARRDLAALGPGQWRPVPPAAAARRISHPPGRRNWRACRRRWRGAPPSRKRPSSSGPAARERSRRPGCGSRSPAT